MAETIKSFANYSPNSLDDDFKRKNEEIISQPRGAGYWLWKPYVILDYLTNHCQDDEMLVYCDAGDFIAPETFDKAKEFLEAHDFMLIKSGHIAYKWTKRDCFVLMGCDSEEYWNTGQVYGGINFWKKTENSIEFLTEWLNYCKNKYILTDTPNVCGKPDFPGFTDHRHDMSILTNLVVKNKIETKPELHYHPWTVQP